MKTYEQIKEFNRQSNISMMNRTFDDLKRLEGRLSQVDINAKLRSIESCKRDLANLDETSLVQIEQNIKNMLETIRSQYRMHSMEYLSNFDKFMMDYMYAQNMSGEYYVHMYFDLSLEEMQMLKGQDPKDPNFGQNLRTYIDQKLGLKYIREMLESKEKEQDFSYDAEQTFVQTAEEKKEKIASAAKEALAVGLDLENDSSRKM